MSPEENNKAWSWKDKHIKKDDVELDLIFISLIMQIMMDPTGVCLAQMIQAKLNW